jgi:hypothetical protein
MTAGRAYKTFSVGEDSGRRMEAVVEIDKRLWFIGLQIKHFIWLDQINQKLLKV